MKPLDRQETEKLESFTSIWQLCRFIIKTYDGWYLIILSVVCLALAAYMAFGSFEGSVLTALALFFYPVLLLVVYVRHRLGTSSSDNSPLVFSFISLTAFALVPIYIIFWR